MWRFEACPGYLVGGMGLVLRYDQMSYVVFTSLIVRSIGAYGSIVKDSKRSSMLKL
jgi:hypothetical protein